MCGNVGAHSYFLIPLRLLICRAYFVYSVVHKLSVVGPLFFSFFSFFFFAFTVYGMVSVFALRAHKKGASVCVVGEEEEEVLIKGAGTFF